jgi:hypothetical protein
VLAVSSCRGVLCHTQCFITNLCSGIYAMDAVLIFTQQMGNPGTERLRNLPQVIAGRRLNQDENSESHCVCVCVWCRDQTQGPALYKCPTSELQP